MWRTDSSGSSFITGRGETRIGKGVGDQRTWCSMSIYLIGCREVVTSSSSCASRTCRHSTRNVPVTRCHVTFQRVLHDHWDQMGQRKSLPAAAQGEPRPMSWPGKEEMKEQAGEELETTQQTWTLAIDINCTTSVSSKSLSS